MSGPDLLVICTSAFLAVFFLLAFLAVVMRTLIGVFPEQDGGMDAAVVAAVTSAATHAYPGMKVTKVEEIQ